MATAIESVRTAYWRDASARQPIGVPRAEPLNPWTSGESDSPAFTAEIYHTCLLDIKRKLTRLVHLNTGWDGHGGAPVTPQIANFAAELLCATMSDNSKSPEIVPLSYGGIQLEWHKNGIDLELEIEAPNKTIMFYHDAASGETVEAEFATDFEQLSYYIENVSVE